MCACYFQLNILIIIAALILGCLIGAIFGITGMLGRLSASIDSLRHWMRE